MNDSSWALVAQQALDMGQSAVADIVAAVQGIAPEMWEMLVRQIYIEAVYFLVWPLLAMSVCGLAFKPLYLRAEETGWNNFMSSVGAGFTGVAMFIFALVWISKLGPVCGRLFNTDLYAIQKLIQIASGGGL